MGEEGERWVEGRTAGQGGGPPAPLPSRGTVRSRETPPERPKGPRDVDSVARAQAVLPLAWFSFVAVMATAAGFVAAGYLGASPALALLLGVAFAAAAATLFYLIWYPLVIGGTVRLFGRIYGGLGGDWQPERTYWRAQALAGRGAVAEAVEAYEDAAGRHPDDPIPCLRAAALCAGELNDPASAVGWYQRARGTGTLDAERDAYVTRRLAELYETWPGHEKRALVELRRLLTLYPESVHAAGARARLEALKARLVRGDQDPRPGSTR